MPSREYMALVVAMAAGSVSSGLVFLLQEGALLKSGPLAIVFGTVFGFLVGLPAWPALGLALVEAFPEGHGLRAPRRPREVLWLLLTFPLSIWHFLAVDAAALLFAGIRIVPWKVTLLHGIVVSTAAILGWCFYLARVERETKKGKER